MPDVAYRAAGQTRDTRRKGLGYACRGARKWRVCRVDAGQRQMVYRAAQSRRGRAGCLAALAFAAILDAAAAPVQTGAVALLPGQSHEGHLAAGQHDRFRVALAAGQGVALVLQQNDAMLRLHWSSDGGESPLLSTQAGRMAAITAHLLAKVATTWTIDVQVAKSDRAATYHLHLGAAHALTAHDRELAVAERQFADAETIRVAAGGVEPGKKNADLATARADYRRAAGHWRNQDAACAVLAANVGLARLEMAQARYPQAQAAAQAALDAGCDDEHDLAVAADRAAALRTLASSLGYEGDFEASAVASERALALYRRTGDQRFQGVVLGNLSAVYRSLGEMQKALVAAQTALGIAIETDDAQGVAFSRENIANAYLARGELASALAAYRRTLDDLRTTPYPMTEGLVWNELGTLYRRLGDSAEAQHAWQHARAVWETTGDRSGMADTWINEGEAALDESAYATAAAAFLRALDIARADRLRSPELHALRGLGMVAAGLGQFGEAARRLQASLALARDIHEIDGEAATEQALGDLDARRGRWSAAGGHYAKALASARRAADVGAEAAASASLSRVAVHAGALDLARRRIERALAIVESQRAGIAEPDLRTGYFASQREYYGLHVDVLMQLDARRPGHGYAARALEASERARARALQDMLSERRIGVDHALDPALLAAEHVAEDRQRKLAYRLARLPGRGFSAERARWQRDIDDASRALDDARGRIRAANPRYAELAHPMPLGLDEIQRILLDDDSSVIEYWLGEPRSYAWVVDRGGVHAYVLPSRTSIERQAAALRAELVGAAMVGQTSMEQLAARAAAGNDTLLRSARALAQQILPADARRALRHQVAIVADGNLQTIPFGILFSFGKLDGEAGAMARARPAPVYLPSIGTLRGLRGLPRSSAPRDAVAVLADPVFRADDSRLRASARTPGSALQGTLSNAVNEAGVASLSRLTHAREEAQSIAALASPRTSWIGLDFAASRDAVLHAAWSDYAIAHFATHALINARHPELSGVVLSLYDANGRGEDGFLNVNDIYNLRMPVDLVVLSVCDSAIGRSIGAEGAFNLARAFFYAGARRVVASLWPVDDRASAVLMRHFYRALLQRHESPQMALADAQDEMGNDPRWRAPAYWAGFVMQGDWQ